MSVSIVEASRKAQKAVLTITNVISEIRSIDAFSPVPPIKEVVKKTSLLASQKTNEHTNSSIQSEEEVGENDAVYLYEKLNENQNLMAEVNEIASSSSSSSSDCSCCKLSNHDKDNDNDNDDTYRHPLEIDRHNVVHKIFLPLLSSLAEMYTLLDQSNVVNINDINMEEQQQEEEKEVEEYSRIKNKWNRRKRPKAPNGLLSLTNYTDIASLLELLVCTSIVPKLEPFILLDIKERVNHTLPKSLRGRIRKKSLLWGTNVLNYTAKWEKKKQQQQLNSQKIQRLQNAIRKIQNAKNELSIVSSIISQIILLDRFRPMLFPRHVSDVYGVLFQLERLEDLQAKLGNMASELCKGDSGSMLKEAKDNTDKRVSNYWIRHIYLQDKLSYPANNCASTTSASEQQNQMSHCQYHLLNNIQPIDIYTKVKSFQSLLLSGKKTPAWLKLRVGVLLTKIATSTTCTIPHSKSNNNCGDNYDIEGLLSIIDVFVVAASSLPTEEMTGASSRLGKALCCVFDEKKSGDDKYYQVLLGQFVKILDFITQEQNLIASTNDSRGNGINDNQHSNNEMNARTVGIILTTWAVLEHIPKEASTKFFVMRLVQGLLPSTSNTNESLEVEAKTESSIQISIGRIRLLLMYTPPGSFHILNNFCHFMTSEIFIADFQISNLPNVSSISSLYSASGVISPFSQILRVACSHGNKTIDCKDVRTAIDVLRMILYTILCKCNKNIIDSCNKEGEGSSESYISLVLLQSISMNLFDLSCYKFRRQPESLNGGGVTYEAVNDNSGMELDLIATMEERSSFVINQILVDDKNLPSEMFKLLLLVYFESSKASKSDCSGSISLPKSIYTKLHEYKIVAMMMLPTLCERFSPASLFMDGILEILNLIISTISKKIQNDRNDISNDIDGGYDSEETQLSILSIVLSLLVGMLELGSKKRSERDEKDLAAMLPSLESLTILTETSFQNPTNTAFEDTERTKYSILKSEIAEMSSHAMAMILSRSIPEENSDNNSSMENTSTIDFINKAINEAEALLSSDQPPLRARAVVQLRQIARGSFEELCKSDEKMNITPTPLITELNNEEVHEPDLGTPVDLIKVILRVCFKALDDTESYVYLAGIQTIVAIADISPHCTMPILVEAITSGQVQVSSFSSSAKKANFSAAQRIKISEALIFTIRRRGGAIRNHFDLIMNSILYGKNSSKAISNGSGLATSSNVQSETEQYFRGINDKQEGEVDEYALPSDNMEERQIRVNTGGPVFDLEENDVVRAACISVATELVSTMHPNAVVPFCPTLTKLGINALRLDHSRIVRRAAALLCREIYSCALREIGNDAAQITEADIRFTGALVQSGEDLLLASLNRCVSGDDVDFSSCHGGVVSSVKGKTRLFDPATVARCQEALHLRDLLGEDGVLDVIRMHLQDHDESQPISRLIARELNDRPKPNLVLDI